MGEIAAGNIRKTSNWIVSDQKNPGFHRSFLYSIEVTMSWLFTHSTCTILEGLKPASASQSPDKVSFGTTL
jgi:hypothetical protein